MARSLKGRRRCRYGAAIRADGLETDPRLGALVAAECDWVTPEIDMKWDVLQPAAGQWNFAPADRIVAFARRHAMSLRGHTLLWEQSTPDWLLRRIARDGDWRPIEDHFAVVLGRYGGDVCEWDVVNEPIDTEHGDGGLRRSAFQRAFGNGYVARALSAARAIAPDAVLMLNEYGLEYTNPVDRARRDALVSLVRALRRDGVPLDGIGMQAHLDLAKGKLDAGGIRDFLKEMRDLGLRLSVTELDVKEASRAASLPVRDAQVADHIRRYLDIVLADDAVGGLVTWGVSDRDSWLQDERPTTVAALNRGLPYDAGFHPKPAHRTIQHALFAPPHDSI